MNKRLGLVLALVCLLVSPVLAGYKTITVKDKFDGYTKIKMQDNKLGVLHGDSCRKAVSYYGYDHKGLFVEFIVQKYTDDKGKTTHQMFWLFHGENWLHMNGDVTLLIDGKRTPLTKGTKLETQTYHEKIAAFDTYCHEGVMFSVTRTFLNKLANAGSVEVKVNGSSSYIERCFGKNNFNNLKKFLADTEE